MTLQQTALLNDLRFGPASAATLADRTGYAVSSVRRDIQAIRRAGHRIDDARDNNGLYRLVTA